MQSAVTWARTQLARKYYTEYRQYYKELKGGDTGLEVRTRAQGKAKTKLTQKYRDEYHELYEQAKTLGYPVSGSKKKKKTGGT